MVVRPRKALRDGLEAVAAAVVLAFLLRTFVVQPFVVHGISMLNSLHNQERVLVEKLAPRFAALHYGEVVVF